MPDFQAAPDVRLTLWHDPRLADEGALMGWVMVGIELAVAAIIALAVWLALRK